MPTQELITACLKNDKAARRQIYETFYGKLSAIALRYAKSKDQSHDLVQNGFQHLFSELGKFKLNGEQSFDDWMTQEFIAFAVKYIRNIRSEYYVASTVRAGDAPEKTNDLFTENIITDYTSVSPDVLVKSLQQLVPSQRLVFNLHVIEEYDLRSISEILEASEQTVKSNLEKARYNLQKNIDKNTKSKNEQLV
jgi:RNA polymerase sigma-70 factor (ECF subfamily)